MHHREQWKPGNALYPLPVVLVTVGTFEKANAITIAWTGTIASDPAYCYISVRPERYSHAILKERKEFAINLSTTRLARAVDWCGVMSGRNVDKFAAMGLTKIPAQKIAPPLIAESPINIECVVTDISSYGSHDMFVGAVVAINADPRYLDAATGAFHFMRAQPICYSHGKYYAVGEQVGKFGFSVKKEKKSGNKKITKRETDKQ